MHYESFIEKKLAFEFFANKFFFDILFIDFGRLEKFFLFFKLINYILTLYIPLN